MKRTYINEAFLAGILLLGFLVGTFGQVPQTAKAELGSSTAKNGFKNEDEIRDKFNNWKLDEDARTWLTTMSYNVAEIESVIATKPHGEKADVEVVVRTKAGSKKEGISIKLVSSPNGFNQIDKRWLSHYVKMWKIPADVEAALKLFVGETPPTGTQAASLPANGETPAPTDLPANIKAKNVQAGSLRSTVRTYLNELEPQAQKAVVDFFTANKTAIVSDLFSGDGAHAAGWVMVALKATDKTRWVLRTDADTIKYFAEGPVSITRQGNLKIGRITVQRKGGDGGRETAKMLQFKINPALLFDAK